MLKSKKIENAIIDNLISQITQDILQNHGKAVKIINNFFNIFLQDQCWLQLMDDFSNQENLLKPNKKFMDSIPTKLHFEFGSINPTGPIHLGHLRSIIVAQCLVNLYKALGINVYKEFFLNNCGHQIHEFIHSIYLRWLESQGQVIDQETIPYKGNYIKNLIPENIPQDTKDFFHYESEIIETVKNKTLNQLESMGVFFDHVTYETNLRSNDGLILEVLNFLIQKQVIAIVDTSEELTDLEGNYDPWTQPLKNKPKNTVILLTQTMGFEKHKIIMKNGVLTYFGADVLYLFDKYNRGFFVQYCFLGEDHIGHLMMLQSLAKILFPDNQLQFIPKKVGFVKVFNPQKELIPMSKRKGKFLDFEEIKKIIGLDFLKMIINHMNQKNMNGV